MQPIYETPLCELAAKYGTDKLSNGYTPFYYELFKDQTATIEKVVELGIGTPRRMYRIPNYQVGASLRMWRDFFPNALVFGIDNDPDAMFHDDRIATFLADERVKKDMVETIGIIGEGINLFVDDGSHQGKIQISTCLTIMPFLGKEAFYIIEDVGLPHEVSQHLRVREYDCVEVLSSKPNCNLVVVRHKEI